MSTSSNNFAFLGVVKYTAPSKPRKELNANICWDKIEDRDELEKEIKRAIGAVHGEIIQRYRADFDSERLLSQLEKRFGEKRALEQLERKRSRLERPTINDIEDMEDEAVAMVYNMASPRVQALYRHCADHVRDSPSNCGTNWLIKWHLWHTFRHRDDRNASRSLKTRSKSMSMEIGSSDDEDRMEAEILATRLQDDIGQNNKFVQHPVLLDVAPDRGEGTLNDSLVFTDRSPGERKNDREERDMVSHIAS